MLRQLLHRLLILAVPATIIIATWFLVPRISSLNAGRQELLLLSPYLITALGMFLSIHFHRGRPFMALLLLIVYYWCSHKFLAGKPLELKLNEIYQAFVLLIPVNFALIVLMRERGLFSTAGRLRFIFLALQTVFVYWLFRYNFTDILPYIACNFKLLPFLDTMLVPAPAIVAGTISFILIAVLVIRRQAPIDSGILGALAAFFIACNWLTDSYIHIAFCSVGAGIITLCVLRDSYNMAFRDDLTGLPSRRSLNETLHGLGRCYTVAMLDVDHFKNFNDTYGHDVGDQVLKMVARIMMDVKGGGKAYRYGGEEFTILFPGCRASDTIPYLEELRKRIADYSLALRSEDRPKKQSQGKGQRGNRRQNAQVSVTISIGVAERSDNLTTTEEVMKAADKALYDAKHNGRNRVEISLN
ncbi:MAG: GGDEF domain-containing protein [Deltaproteobacteria bacterium]